MEPVSSDQLAAWAGEARERWNVPGIAVGLLRDGQTVTTADGVRELEAEEAVSASDVFRIASITKPFVATLAMTLVQDGLLDLDEPPAGARVSATVRQLLSHQGGLACESTRALDVAPGDLFSYSNAGFWLVGAAIAQACGAGFEDAMRVRVLEPLRLETTGFEVEHAVPGHNQVVPGGDEHRRAEASYPPARRPSGGLWSSVGDLLRFAAHHLGAPGPLEAASVQELQRPIVDGPGFRHGLGWFLRERAGRPSLEHAGSVAGYQSLLLLLPGEGIAFAALTNSSRGAAAIRDLLDRLGLSAPVLDDFPLEPEQLAAFAGRYEAPGVRIDVVPDGRYLRLEYGEGEPLTREWHCYPPVPLRPVAEREFEVAEGEWRGQRLGFPRDGVVSFGVVAHRVR